MGIVTTGVPYTSDILRYDIGKLRQKYPFLCCRSVGNSVMGTDIWCLSIGTGEKHILYNAAHHANEWITTPLAMKFLENLCEAKCTAGSVSEVEVAPLLERVTFTLVPMVNPDGVDLATGGIDKSCREYKNAFDIRGTLRFPDDWKANIHGVDLNNNYPALFERGRDEKNALGVNIAGPRDYTGLAPLSEPETTAMIKLTRELLPALTVALHSQGREIYWRFNDITPPRAHHIGCEMARVSGYTLCDPPGCSYGGYKDWFVSEFNLPGFTVEVGEGENPLPIESLNGIYEEIEAMLLIGLTEA